jgi:hypothetical protein
VFKDKAMIELLLRKFTYGSSMGNKHYSSINEIDYNNLFYRPTSVSLLNTYNSTTLPYQWSPTWYSEFLSHSNLGRALPFAINSNTGTFIGQRR